MRKKIIAALEENMTLVTTENCQILSSKKHCDDNRTLKEDN